MKLTLSLEDLAVDSFETTADEKRRGTVFGEQCTCITQCGQMTCAEHATCDTHPTDGCSCVESCWNTCGNTCPDTCGYTCDDRSCVCNTQNPCTTALYTNCNGLNCH